MKKHGRPVTCYHALTITLFTVECSPRMCVSFQYLPIM